MLASYGENILMYFLGCKGLSNDGVVGVARGTVFQEIRPGASFKTGDLVREKLGGLPTVELLFCCIFVVVCQLIIGHGLARRVYVVLVFLPKSVFGLP